LRTRTCKLVGGQGQGLMVRGQGQRLVNWSEDKDKDIVVGGQGQGLVNWFEDKDKDFRREQ